MLTWHNGAVLLLVSQIASALALSILHGMTWSLLEIELFVIVAGPFRVADAMSHEWLDSLLCC
jgi:hypothetical protein